MSRPVLVASSLIVGAVVLGACGGAPAPAQAPKSTGPTTPSGEREPSSVEEAQQQIDRASAELAGGAGGAEKKTPAAVDSAPEPRTEEAAKPDACASSCRALASMRRAVTALCRMAGDGDARCSDAKKTLADSESRVARCHCAS